MTRMTCIVLLAMASAAVASDMPCDSAAVQPNVILVMTDDQGYGDLSYHGNPVLKTPHLDKLAGQSVRFTDFHVMPMCTPTRGQLMTGLDAMRNGATAVCQGRSMIRGDIRLMPRYFKQAGYATGLFGKWHLGDSYPHRPQDRGFDEVLSHNAWGIPSLAGHWESIRSRGGCYFDPWLKRNGVLSQHKGYCTDIFFDEAKKWMAARHEAGEPFFCYIPTNTPHVPNIAPEKYRKSYRGKYKNITMPDGFYGMIANIDENMGKLEVFLKERGLRDNTILVFLTDNGTQSEQAQQIFNAGMRERKTSVMEGGHRVPLFVRWPGGNLKHDRAIAELTTVQDILPTLINLCGLNEPDEKLDGVKLAGLLRGTRDKLDDRMVVVQYRTGGGPYESAVVMWGKWRLLNPRTLFNIADDPRQDRNVAADHPEIVKKMTAHYETWHARTRPQFDKKRWIIIGSEQANPTTLYANDWTGGFCDNPGNLRAANTTGYWNVIVERDGDYAFELRRWPEESNKPLTEAFAGPDRKDPSARPIAKARLIVGDFDQTIDTKPGDTVARFTVNLKAGRARIEGRFLDDRGKTLCGAMYTTVHRDPAKNGAGITSRTTEK